MWYVSSACRWSHPCFTLPRPHPSLLRNLAGCQNTKLTPLIDGCPNFRQVEGLPVFGVAVPTVSGLRLALDEVRRRVPAGTRIYWRNMREEPLIYITGRPFVVREITNPFRNLEYTGAVSQMGPTLELSCLYCLLSSALHSTSLSPRRTNKYGPTPAGDRRVNGKDCTLARGTSQPHVKRGLPPCRHR